jgi:hypothetical protein
MNLFHNFNYWSVSSFSGAFYPKNGHYRSFEIRRKTQDPADNSARQRKRLLISKAMRKRRFSGKENSSTQS